MGEVFPDRSCYASREETFPHPTKFLRKILVEEGPMPHIKEKESQNGNEKERAKG
jgi:hypothetical protein